MNLLNILHFTNSRAISLVFLLALGAIFSGVPQTAFAQSKPETTETDEKLKNDTTGTTQLPGAKTFDNVTIERIRPENLPEASPKMPPAVVYQKDQRLPGIISQKALQETGKNVANAVVQIISIHMPPKPYRQTPMVHRGHAVWLSVDANRPPVLISTLDWLADAQTIYILPADIGNEFAMRDPNSSKGAFRSLDSMTVQAFDSKIIDRHKDQLIEVRREQPTAHQNLVQLKPVQPDKLEMPTRGLTIVNTENALPLQIYGYSPFVAHSLVQTTMILEEPDDESLSFYIQTTFPGILGAPIVGPDGQVIALNALAYPGKPQISLAVPSSALRTYVFGLK